MAYWYKRNIEDPLKYVVHALRNNGINTVCSCGHRRFIQCETYHLDDDLRTIFDILIGELKIKSYRALIFSEHEHKGLYKKYLEIQFPDKKGQYYQELQDNVRYQKFEGRKEL